MEYKAKIIKIGNSYGITVPIAFLKHDIIDKNKPVNLELKQNE